MKRTVLAIALISALLFSTAAGTSFVGLTTANPFDLPVDTGIRIYSTNYSSYQVKPYENSTVTLKIQVLLVYGYYDQFWAENVNLDSMSYSLDEQPLVYINNIEKKNHTNYGRDKQHFLEYTATVRLEDLSEGTHTVTAYANDMSSSYNFTVNSHYVVTDVKPMPSPVATPQPSLSIDPNFSFYCGLALMIISVAVFAGLLAYFKKRKH
jgi:hypothetical protein